MSEPTPGQAMAEMSSRQIQIATIMLSHPEPTMPEITNAVQASGELTALPWWCGCGVCMACFVAGAHIAGLVRILGQQVNEPAPRLFRRLMTEKARQEGGHA
jgi:hypothetical protein